MITYACALKKAKEHLMDSEVLCKLHMRVSFPKGGISATSQRSLWKPVICQLNSQECAIFD